jgi:hypothetical protein
MTEEEYIEERLNDQIIWYSKKSQTNKKWFKGLRLLEIIVAAIIPFLAGIGSVVPYYSIIIGSLGVIIAVSAGLSALICFVMYFLPFPHTLTTGYFLLKSVPLLSVPVYKKNYHYRTVNILLEIDVSRQYGISIEVKLFV